MEATGRQTVPCLCIQDSSGDVRSMHELLDIIADLERFFVGAYTLNLKSAPASLAAFTGAGPVAQPQPTWPAPRAASSYDFAHLQPLAPPSASCSVIGFPPRRCEWVFDSRLLCPSFSSAGMSFCMPAIPAY